MQKRGFVGTHFLGMTAKFTPETYQGNTIYLQGRTAMYDHSHSLGKRIQQKTGSTYSYQFNSEYLTQKQYFIEYFSVHFGRDIM